MEWGVCLKTGRFPEGNLEFGSSNYGPRNGQKIPGASDRVFDFGDEFNGDGVGYGAMQIHNYPEKQTIFAYNNFQAGSNADLGIGNSGGANPDWTFTRNASAYRRAVLQVLVELEPASDGV